MDVRAEARCGEVARCGQAAPDLDSAGVLTYRLELRCGVVFPKLSKLLNQENALSAPYLRYVGVTELHATFRESLRFCVTFPFATPKSSRRQALMFCRWLAADARVEESGAKPSRAVVVRRR